MTSRRVFELANITHEFLSSHGESKYVFGGKLVILVGDFVQLRPVANFFDLGRFVFDSPLFIKSIPHRYDLKMLLNTVDIQMCGKTLNNPFPCSFID